MCPKLLEYHTEQFNNRTLEFNEKHVFLSINKTQVVNYIQIFQFCVEKGYS